MLIRIEGAPAGVSSATVALANRFGTLQALDAEGFEGFQPGEVLIAPMTTALLLSMRPSAAIRVEMQVRLHPEIKKRRNSVA